MAPRRPRRPRPEPGGRRGARPRRAPQRPPVGLTGRAAVLGLVVCALVLSLAYPVKQYLAERSVVTQLERDHASAQQRVDDLERQRRKLSDPTYVRELARQRLQYVMPGDTAYVVVTPGQPDRSAHPAPTTRRPDSDEPWYSQLWESVHIADDG